MAAVAGDTAMAPQSTFAPNLAPNLAPTIPPNTALGRAPGERRWYRTGALMLELCLTLLIAALLAHIAAPLALPDLAPGVVLRVNRQFTAWLVPQSITARCIDAVRQLRIHLRTKAPARPPEAPRSSHVLMVLTLSVSSPDRGKLPRALQLGWRRDGGLSLQASR